MKSHTITGDRILDSVSPMKDSEKLMRVAHEIVRSHHERWDGSGYPDGLAGDEIPISAQVVALADVYDALTSERCYKKAVPHKTAIRMIADGKCGAFNPILIECLRDADDELCSDPEKRISDSERRNDAIMMTNEVLAGKSLVIDGLSQRLAEAERIKKKFFAVECKGIVFEYFAKLKKVTYRSEYEGGKMREYFADEKNNAMTDHLLAELTLEEVKEEEGDRSLDGMVFVITGSVEHFANRKELQTLIESKGGKATGSVTSKTTYLINNDVNSTSSKNKKARELGIPILSEEDFLKLLNFVVLVEKDDFWRSEIVQIVVAKGPDGAPEIELVPRTGSHTVIFGSPDDAEEKLAKLLTFYRRGLRNIGWEEYRTINVKYKEQVVCTK